MITYDRDVVNVYLEGSETIDVLSTTAATNTVVFRIDASGNIMFIGSLENKVYITK
jgi:hypothetical protein